MEKNQIKKILSKPDWNENTIEIFSEIIDRIFCG